MTHAMLRSFDPHDGSVVGELRAASTQDVRYAVQAAHDAFPAWAKLPFDERAAKVVAAGPALEAGAEELASLIHREMGKPMGDALREAQGMARGLERFADMARKAVESETLREGDVETTLRRDPLGVVAIVSPWNFPLWVPGALLLPALLVGNTVVHKPSEKTPLTGERFTALLASTLPDGVLVHLAGGSDVGRELVASPHVQMVGFTGSQDAGRAIMAACASGLKRIVLELGGKDPMIVLADADLDAAATFAAANAFRNSGQVCCSVERIVVERSVAEALTARIVEKAKATEIGPLADVAQRDKVAAQVLDAVKRGARVLAGGSAPDRPGAWYPPTVLADVDDSMDIASRETFGPVAAIRTVEDAEEAVRVANGTDYALGASVWTGDAARGEAIAARLHAGMIGINRGLRGVGDSPWVGAKQSGFGFSQSVEGTRQFTQVRTVTRRVG